MGENGENGGSAMFYLRPQRIATLTNPRLTSSRAVTFSIDVTKQRPLNVIALLSFDITSTSVG